MKIFVSVLFWILSAASFGEALKGDVFEPANLKNSSWSLQNRIKFPNSFLNSKEDLNVVVRCDALLSRRGKFKSNMCYENGDFFYPYVTVINRAAKKSTVKPGKVNGTSRIVYFQYYVVFMKNGDKHSIDVIPNSGLDVERYGFDYTSPQRYREGSGRFGVGCGKNKKITVNAIISEQGIPSAVKVVGDNLGDKCEQYMQKAFLSQKYIPAIIEGKAVAAYYSEKVFNSMRFQ